MGERTFALTVQVLARGEAGAPDRQVMRCFARGLSWQEARAKRQEVYQLADQRHRRRPNIQIVSEWDAGDGVPHG